MTRDLRQVACFHSPKSYDYNTNVQEVIRLCLKKAFPQHKQLTAVVANDPPNYNGQADSLEGPAA
jgi:hypothetical protein